MLYEYYGSRVQRMRILPDNDDVEIVTEDGSDTVYFWNARLEGGMAYVYVQDLPEAREASVGEWFTPRRVQ